MLKPTDRRGSVGFRVVYPDTLVVLTPKNFRAKVLEDIIDERLPWAEKRLAEKRADYKRRGLPKSYSGGETFPYLGHDYPLVVVESASARRPRCEFIDGRFFVETVPGTVPGTETDVRDRVRKALQKWYKDEAEKRIKNRVAFLAPVIGKAPASVSVRNQKARWGSCSTKGSINFNWRLIMVRPEILDYVVVHELCHLLEHNHSWKYWAHVERVMPDYPVRRRELKEAGYLLEID